MYNINKDNSFSLQTNFLWQLDRLREWKSEGDSVPIQMEINPTNYCSEAYRWCITNYSHVINPSMSNEVRQSQFRKPDGESIISNHSEHRRELESKFYKRFGRAASCGGVPRIRGEENGVKYAIKVIHKEDNSYWVSGEAQRGNDKHNIVQRINDEAEFARILIEVKALLMALFDKYSERGKGMIMPETDDTSKENDLKSKIERVEFAHESWQNYKSKNKLWREVLKDSGLVCGDRSSSLKSVLELIELAVTNDFPVLIRGETGTGKELVAEAIHNLSHRGKLGKDLVAVNIGSYSKELIYSELFGYEKGAFTGASDRREGKFETANGSTLFLDEIGTMGPEAQVNLLRVLEKGVIDRLGSNRPRKVNVRVVAATNENLEKMVSEKKFREDLYYRLNVFTIKLPPLRERPQDIPALVQYFSNSYASKKNREEVPYDEELFKSMICYKWRGNIRELKKFIMVTQECGKKNEISFSDIEHIDLSRNLKGATEKYKSNVKQIARNSEQDKLVSKLADISGRMFEESWELLDRAWEKWQQKRGVDIRDIKLRKEIFYQELDNRDSQRLEEIIHDALKQFRLFLESEGYSDIPNSNCYSMLMSCYRSNQKVEDIDKAVKQTLLDVLSKLKERQFSLSNQLEREHYDRFRDFFGKTHRSVRAWKNNKFWTKQISTLPKSLVLSLLVL
jgi:DNA-binding NtrC family response regulator